MITISTKVGILQESCNANVCHSPTSSKLYHPYGMPMRAKCYNANVCNSPTSSKLHHPYGMPMSAKCYQLGHNNFGIKLN